jgi:ATP-dependent helicase HrpB
MSWGESSWESFPWFEAPPAGAWEQARALLRRLGAVAEEQLTQLGRQLARLPLHPRLGRLLIEACPLGCAPRAALAAALLAERDPFVSSERSASVHSSPSDVLDRVQALEDFAENGHVDSHLGRLHPAGARHILRVRDQLLRAAVEAGLNAAVRATANEASFLRAVTAAFPDRIARRREQNSDRGVMVGGRGVRLDARSVVRDSEFFACVDVAEVGGAESIVRQASRVQRDWLPPSLVTNRVEVDFDWQRERVRVVRRIRYEDLLLEESQAEAADPQEISRVLCEAAGRQLDRALPLQDEKVDQFLARLRSLRIWIPQLGLPEFSPDELAAVLPSLCQGCRSFADLRAAPLVDTLRAALTPVQLSALERDAPERLAVASGSRIRLHYEPGRPPILAVRIQEMYGQLETPRVAGGRVSVLLHLLAPNGRPQQITDDLQGFWERGYPQVRKELRRRYPKHAWPEDPIHAAPESRPRKRPAN